MFHLLIDTCVWLDYAKDHQKESLLTVIEALVEKKDLFLIVPQTVMDEFQRNKDHVAKDGNKSLTAAIKRTGQAIQKFGDPKKRGAVLKLLGDVEYKIPQMGERALASLNQVDKILKASSIISTSQSVLLSAGQRAIEKRAPFHKGKNSMNDAILIETYNEYISANGKPGDRFAFVTHNKHDYSDPIDERVPHADIAQYFSRRKSIYSINLAKMLHRIKPELVTDIMMDLEYVFVPRSLGEIYKAEEEVDRKVWYNRHQIRAEKIALGQVNVVDKDEMPHDLLGNTILKDIWVGAKRAAREVEKKYGLENLGPWDDFEWGMINGKLSALRWVMGDDWDSLDT